ncbi:PREDICTED: non-structural maintenance of chromosomes element 1 homolog [Amphimedon queenslandica]|uniref:Non-structural maintenance of chromosomes element 1 homolog n=1 Tax=Amphimedon queenslandica TaxID=400682 RepID=A0A1X7UTM8_AMPQE|nr:PREDICTED: non-structural maintenance of chromosomes element 1 homolog [Amphimedon queenslandica]|eukprot:XP_003386908.2 PREDICTED: non-structural maintenance of chromosomes element 1 homolog [Amphimedon queenslandica]
MPHAYPRVKKMASNSRRSSGAGSSRRSTNGMRERASIQYRDGEMTNAHRHFLQSLMSKRIMTKREAKKTASDSHRLYNEESSGEGPLFTEFVQTINAKLESLGFKIGMSKVEHDGSEWVGFANTSSTGGGDVIQKASGLGLAELEFFRTCLQQMVTEENNGVASSSALLAKLNTLQRKMTGKAAQDLLVSLTKDHWFFEISRGHYCMGPRCFIELLPFLPEIVGESIEECRLCSNRVVMGDRCLGCDTKLHTYCIVQLSRRGQVKCPQCHEEWEGEIPTLE